ncbi:MAG: hypothetical protein HY543_10435 [Deltaproteobacteria bacterium]|nr:hypothetical protein [Deltaproteobacteria bacterium]
MHRRAYLVREVGPRAAKWGVAAHGGVRAFGQTRGDHNGVSTAVDGLDRYVRVPAADQTGTALPSALGRTRSPSSWCGSRLARPILVLALVAGCGEKTEAEILVERIEAFYEAHDGIHAAWAANHEGAARLSEGAWNAAADAYARARSLALATGREARAKQLWRERTPNEKIIPEGWDTVPQQAIRLVRDNGLLQGYTWLAAAQRCVTGGRTSSCLPTRYYQNAALAFRTTGFDLAEFNIDLAAYGRILVRLLAMYAELSVNPDGNWPASRQMARAFETFLSDLDSSRDRDEVQHRPLLWVEQLLTESVLPHLSDDADRGIRGSAFGPFLAALEALIARGIADPQRAIEGKSRGGGN